MEDLKDRPLDSEVLNQMQILEYLGIEVGEHPREQVSRLATHGLHTFPLGCGSRVTTVKDLREFVEFRRMLGYEAKAALRKKMMGEEP